MRVLIQKNYKNYPKKVSWKIFFICEKVMEF